MQIKNRAYISAILSAECNIGCVYHYVLHYVCCYFTSCNLVCQFQGQKIGHGSNGSHGSRVSLCWPMTYLQLLEGLTSCLWRRRKALGKACVSTLKLIFISCRL